MRSVSLLAATLFVACGLAIESNEAKAQGIHFGAGPVHINVGNPHGGYYRGNYGNPYGYYGGYRQVYNHGYWGGGHTWHDTSHYDYHPGEYVRHRNHYHYQPGHYDFHQEGHWDHHH